MTHHLNNVPRLRAGFETARQAATSAELHALTIVPCPSPYLLLYYISRISRPLYDGTIIIPFSNYILLGYELHIHFNNSI